MRNQEGVRTTLTYHVNHAHQKQETAAMFLHEMMTSSIVTLEVLNIQIGMLKLSMWTAELIWTVSRPCSKMEIDKNLLQIAS